MNEIKKPVAGRMPKKYLNQSDINLSETEKAELEKRKQAIASVQDDDVISRTTVVLKKSIFKRYKQFLVSEDEKMRTHLEGLIEKHLDEYEAKKGK